MSPLRTLLAARTARREAEQLAEEARRARYEQLTARIRANQSPSQAAHARVTYATARAGQLARLAETAERTATAARDAYLAEVTARIDKVRRPA